MRSALICVFFALIMDREGSRATNDEEFKPTPIPLNEWHGEKKEAGTLQEVIATDEPPSVAAVPAHYWEDALRHSVYLTLVRDKIDQLIVKGNVNSPNGKLEHASKEVDDHNLWEKIKSAPFDRLSTEEPAILGDITIMSKGRLLEGKNGYRFTEDANSGEKCSEEKCMKGVKAFWSVKRVRQRDAETVPGKYHYELTFSVNSPTPKKHKKPFDNPARTFTVREGTAVEQPQHNPEPPVSYAPRPQRAVWFHKNIVPTQHYQSRKNYQPQSLDRFFLSLFSSEEDRYDEPPRYKPNPYVQQGYPQHNYPQHQHSKVGYVGSTDQHHQKKLMYKPTQYKYTRPPLGPPPSVSQAEHHYLDADKTKIPFSPPEVQHYPIDVDGKITLAPPHSPHYHIDSDSKTKSPLSLPQVPHFRIDAEVKTKNPYPLQPHHYDMKSKAPYPPTQVNHHYIEPDVKKNPYAPSDHRYQPSNVVKTTKPAVLPTPTYPSNNTMEVTNAVNSNESTTAEPEQVTAFRPYPKHKPPPTKLSYFPEHVRPPVFNAPPGVFMTMDKKPFKPMPPLKYHHPHSHPHPHHMHSKPAKSRPVDFRPSPQVLDAQFSDPDPLSDAFRPMGLNYADSNTTETSEKAGSGKRKNIQHKNVHKSKPPKKHELIQPQRTTSTPEIITAQSLNLQSIEEEAKVWATNYLGAFARTTPMVSQKVNITETTTPFEQTTTVSDPTTTVTLDTTFVEEKKPETTTSPRPPKRTRPPPKFTKPSKLKKHKRITTTTTTTTSTTTTTEKPRIKRPLPDLSPQASSAATGTTKPTWQPKSKIQNDTTTTDITRVTVNTTNVLTTSRPFTTTTKPTIAATKPTTTSTPTPLTEPPVTTSQPKNNRFRISTLMHKGTSVNHDKWTMPIIDRNRTAQSNAKSQQRRKGSNFHGYLSSTPKNVEEDNHNKDHIDLAYSEISSTTQLLLEVIPVTPEPPQPILENQVEEQADYPNGTEETEKDEEDDSEESDDDEDEDEEEESKDHTEFIFSSTPPETSESNNEVIEPNQEVKEESVVTTTYATVKNKTKCKKKMNQNYTTTEESLLFVDAENDHSNVVTENVSTTTEKTMDFFSQIFGGYSVEGLPHNDSKVEPLGEGSAKEERFTHIDDDLEDFLHSLEEKKHDNETNYDQYDEDRDDEVDYSFNSEEESRTSRHADVSYEDYRDRPYSFLELMAME